MECQIGVLWLEVPDLLEKRVCQWMRDEQHMEAMEKRQHRG